MKANFTPSQKEYKNITPFKLFVIEQFPFIEANFDAITEWRLLQEIGGKLNEIINNMDNVTDNTINLYNSYVALENYVNDYFDNLDVQDEINNKLNDMALDGTLQEIITSYIETNALLIFNNVNEMKQANNLINGSKCKTLGYYSINDGGGATYLIRNITNNDIVNNGSIIALNNENLIAELIETNINVKQFGAKGDGVTDDTNAIQNTLNYRKHVFVPKGTFCVTQLNINQYQYLYGSGNKNSIIKSTLDNTNNDVISTIIPATSDRVTIKDLRFIGGIDNASTGVANVQDVNNTFENIVVENGYGFKIHHRGSNLNNCRCGSTKYGFYITGTDNNLDNCISSVTDSHGFAITNANNSLSSCKAFIAGNKQYGVGIIVAGAFCRLSNCEAQQNRFENYLLQNAFGLITENCLSDGAFWGKSDITEYNNPNFNINVKTNAILLHNLVSCVINITNINGSTFNNSVSSTQEVLGIPYPATIHKCNINLTSYNRNNYNTVINKSNLFKYVSNNSIICNGINYNSFINDCNDIVSEIAVSYNENVSEQKTFFTKKLSNDTKHIAINFENVPDKSNFATLFWDVMIVTTKDGATNYKNIPNQPVNQDNNAYYDIQSVLNTINYDEIVSIAFRLIGKNKTDLDAFTFTLKNVSIKSTKSEIPNSI